jgi:hypothetical protein
MDSDKKHIDFLGVFGIDEMFLIMSSNLARLNLTCDTPLLDNLLKVCKKMSYKRGNIPSAIRHAMCSLLRIDEPIILKITEELNETDGVHLFKRYHVLRKMRVSPVLGNYLAAGAPNTGERFIPSGYRKEYMTRDPAVSIQLSDDEQLNQSRSLELLGILNMCICGIGSLNQLVGYGVFAHPDNRQDAIDIIAFMRSIDHWSHFIINDRASVRCDNLVYLLKNSYCMGDISNIGMARFAISTAQKLTGIQITFKSSDLDDLNSKITETDEYLTYLCIEQSIGDHF